MTKLEQLINELCPDGVEYKKIGEVCSTITDFTAAGSFADIAKNVKYINNEEGYAQLIRTTDLKSSFSKSDSFVYVDEHAFEYLWRVNLDSEGLVMPNVGNCGEVYYVTPDILPREHNVLGPNAIWVKSDIALNRFLYHLFQCKEFQDKLIKIVSPVGQTKFNKTNFKELTIPVPPIEVQREIVRILDNFTELTAELTVELTAELTARKKQYEYYRDKLLLSASNVSWMSLGDVCRLVTGATPSKIKKEYWENGTIPWMSSGEVNLKRVYSTETKITQLGYDSASTTLVPMHSVVIALAGQGKTRGKVAITEIELCTNQSLCSIICGEKLYYKYLYYYLDSRYNELRSISNGDGTRGGLSLRILSPYQVPVPSLEEQHRIVDILDRFDVICNDISAGLPAEIEARQKQYEYYRDKLLTFKSIEG